MANTVVVSHLRCFLLCNFIATHSHYISTQVAILNLHSSSVQELAKSVAEFANSVRNSGWLIHLILLTKIPCGRMFFSELHVLHFVSNLEISRLNDSTIEERVTILEFQVNILNTDVEFVNTELADQAEDLDRIEGEIAILSADQVLQDERLLELEMDSDGKLNILRLFCG